MKLLTALALPLILSSCMTADLTSHGELFSLDRDVPAHKAIVYFYTHETRGGNACWIVGINNERQNCLGFPGYARAVVDSGERLISFTPNAPIKIANMKFNFNFEEGKKYFIEYIEAGNELPENTIYSHYNSDYDTVFAWVINDEDDAIEFLTHLRAWQ